MASTESAAVGQTLMQLLSLGSATAGKGSASAEGEAAGGNAFQAALMDMIAAHSGGLDESLLEAELTADGLQLPGSGELLPLDELAADDELLENIQALLASRLSADEAVPETVGSDLADSSDLADGAAVDSAAALEKDEITRRLEHILEQLMQAGNPTSRPADNEGAVVEEMAATATAGADRVSSDAVNSGAVNTDAAARQTAQSQDELALLAEQVDKAADRAASAEVAGAAATADAAVRDVATPDEAVARVEKDSAPSQAADRASAQATAQSQGADEAALAQTVPASAAAAGQPQNNAPVLPAAAPAVPAAAQGQDAQTRSSADTSAQQVAASEARRTDLSADTRSGDQGKGSADDAEQRQNQQRNLVAAGVAGTEVRVNRDNNIELPKPVIPAGASNAVGGLGSAAVLAAEDAEQRLQVAQSSSYQQLQQLARGNNMPALAFVVPESVGSSRWAEAASQRISWMSNQQLGRAELRLDPPELGSLNVRLSLHNDQATLSFTSPHAHVRDALEQQMPRLRDMLAEQGIQLQQSNVSDQSGSGQSSGSEQDQDNRASVSSASLAETELLAEGGELRLGSSLSMVDYYA